MVEYVVTCQYCDAEYPASEARVEVKGREVEIEFDCPNPGCLRHNLYSE